MRTAGIMFLVTALAWGSDALYMLPDSDIAQIVDAPLAPRVSVSPDYTVALLRTPMKNPTVADLAQTELRLAGVRFRPVTLAPSRARVYTDLALLNLSTAEIIGITGLPEVIRSLTRAWSPDGTKLAVTLETAQGIELWLIDAETAAAKPLTGPDLNLVSRCYPKWLPDGTGVLALVGTAPGEPPKPASVPTGPVIMETTGEETPVRTLQDLFETPYDEELFQHYLTAQLTIIRLDGSTTPVGTPGIIWDFDPSPDGIYILVHELHRPFSYSFTAGSFPMEIRVMDLSGDSILQVADLPLRDNIPMARGSVHTGPRSVHWRDDARSTLCWVVAMDNGDASMEAAVRDKILLLSSPFTGQPQEYAELEFRYGGIDWGTDSLAIVWEWWWPQRLMRAWRVAPAAGIFPVEPFLEYSWEDAYQDPGSPVMVTDTRGRSVLLSSDENEIYMIGDGASPEGNIPFLHRYNDGETQPEAVFTSEAPYYERPRMFADSNMETLLFVRESPDEYPNYFIRDLQSGEDTQVTAFPDPAPELRGMNRELLQYTRADGVELSGLLYTPAGYSPADGRLPVIVWAYPEEFVSADAASRITTSPYEYDNVGWWSPLIWLTRGFAVLDYPSMPIIGENGNPPNNTYISQLVMNAEAAVNAVVATGVGERDRFIIGGHSYGAFMAVNLLAHSDLFKAGIASTGAYNRTLTPFGFQSEDRNLWEASEVYWAMSPFMHADKIDEPLLIFHGEADNNPGTFPIQSERLFGALAGLGKTARLVKLPLEGHIYSGRESVMHYLWEISQWLDKYMVP